MSDMDFDGFFDELEKIEQERLLKKTASQLLLESAAPFDAACMKVKAMEKQLEQQAKSIDELVEALEEAACKGVFDKYSIAIDNGIKDKYRAIANNYKTNKQDKS